MLEQVQLDLRTATQRMPYRNYYQQRNGLVAQKIASKLGLPYTGEVADEPHRNAFLVPQRTYVRGENIRPDILESDFYGTLVDNIEHVEKAVLHPSVSSRIPPYYSTEFADRVSGFVLPGLTAFSKDDMLSAYINLQREHPIPYRLKLPDQSDGHGQFIIASEEDLKQYLESMSSKEIALKGLVLEPQLQDPQTISVGYCVLGEDAYSFVSFQKNDTGEDGRMRYAGAEVMVVRDGMDELSQVVDHLDSSGHSVTHVDEAIQASIGFHQALSLYNPVSSRLSFDHVRGLDGTGAMRGGITDITGRLGGTCPALIMAIEHLDSNPHTRIANSVVNLTYEPEGKPLMDEEVDATAFIDHPTLRITAKLKEHIL
ncbi:MAG: hypothetical protein RI947_1551 [Candidatus Parcubacteria bacterium]|jgi:hypothetical protein